MIINDDIHIQEIKSDLKSVASDVSEMKVQTALNTASLVEHLRRTQASEDRLTIVEQTLITFQNTIQVSLKIATILGSMAVFFQHLFPILIKLFSH